MSRKGIPEALEREVCDRAANGATTREISGWLLDAHAVTASYGAVARVIKRVRTERAEVTKAVVQAKLAKSALSDIDLLESIRLEVSAKAKKLTRADQAGAWRGLKELELKIIDTKLHYSGADEPDVPNGEGRRPGILIPPERDE